MISCTELLHALKTEEVKMSKRDQTASITKDPDKEHRFFFEKVTIICHIIHIKLLLLLPFFERK